jgi:hypothetical protein
LVFRFRVSLGGQRHASEHTLKPPPGSDELPTLRFRPQDEDDEVQDDSDLYGDVYEEPSRLWRLVKRVLVLGVLVVGGYFGFLTRDSWLPVVDRQAMALMEAIDGRLRPASPPPLGADEAEKKRSQEAVATAAEQIPQLSPETIQLIMESSVLGVLDPAEVFERSHDAVQRGQALLATEEADELKALQGELLAVLGPGDRSILREYEATRAMRATLPYEDRQALILTAKGARALAPEKLVRLRLLSAKAVVAAPSAPVTPAPAAPATPAATS